MDPTAALTLSQGIAIVITTAGLSAAIGRLLAPWKSLSRTVERLGRIVECPDSGPSLIQRVDKLEQYLVERKAADERTQQLLVEIRARVAPPAGAAAGGDPNGGG